MTLQKESLTLSRRLQKSGWIDRLVSRNLKVESKVFLVSVFSNRCRLHFCSKHTLKISHDKAVFFLGSHPLTRKIVCSELAYVVYNDMEWPTDKQLGRYTISPDHVAMKVGETKDFTGVLLYHDGKRVKNNINKNLNFLLEGKYSQIQFD